MQRVIKDKNVTFCIWANLKKKVRYSKQKFLIWSETWPCLPKFSEHQEAVSHNAFRVEQHSFYTLTADGFHTTLLLRKVLVTSTSVLLKKQEWFICVYTHTYIYIPYKTVHIYMYTDTYTYSLIHTFICVCMCVRVCVYIYTYIYTVLYGKGQSSHRELEFLWK